MESEIGQAVLAGSASAQDFSIIGMFMTATITVKLVIILLLAASVWCWAIILEKARRFRKVRAQAEKFEEQFWSGKPLDELYARIGEKPGHPMAALFVAAMKEWQRASERGGMKPNLPERVHKVMAVTLSREMERLEKYLGVLATVGSTAPFVGLFGTVWGIMNSFQSIAQSNNTSLAVVAPGIAEALFATALGLIAAIPAVIAYNKFSSDLGRYANRLEGFAEEFNAILVRQIEDGDQ